MSNFTLVLQKTFIVRSRLIYSCGQSKSSNLLTWEPEFLLEFWLQIQNQRPQKHPEMVLPSFSHTFLVAPNFWAFSTHPKVFQISHLWINSAPCMTLMYCHVTPNRSSTLTGQQAIAPQREMLCLWNSTQRLTMYIWLCVEIYWIEDQAWAEIQGDHIVVLPSLPTKTSLSNGNHLSPQYEPLLPQIFLRVNSIGNSHTKFLIR